MQRWLVLTIAAVPLVLSSFRTPTPGLVWWTTHALDKVRPHDSVPGVLEKTVSIAAARNEFEPFQIVLRAESEQIDDIDVDIGDLAGPGGAVIPKQNHTVYFEATLDLKRPSTTEGRPGEWPDPLIPRVDRYFGERRTAFPFKLTEGRNQPIWIDVYVPAKTPPGNYSGDVAITVAGKRRATIPVKLQVWNFTLSSTSSLPNTYGFNGISAIYQHMGKYTNDEDVYQITNVYMKSALWHRISLHGGTMSPPPFTVDGDRVEIDWRNYDREVGPFLDGTAFRPDEPLFGARATSVDMRTSGNASTDQLKILYWRDWTKHFREKGWFDRLFNYLWDEPAAGDSAALQRKAQLVHSADPEIRNLVTSPMKREWEGVVDIWSPLINCFERRVGFQPFCDPDPDRRAYDPELQRGKRLWWYQSCASHGCNTIGGEYFSGWPSYMIDISPVANRIMQWMAWKYGIQGELYFNTTEAYTKGGNPWDSVNLFGGNGDGTLFYPGRPDRIGGKTHIPIESIRLKLIREGLEDYEYIRMLGADSTTVVNSIVHKTYEFDHDPAKLYAARRRMGEELSKRGRMTN